ncbi:class I SAM-dependent methyltransferase [Agrobacterium tumefaciens]|uniref:class I SAM-dependent methyltransferase n=1 Tax=Agrobacterium tumefaciens TaxID=358 RepID=UPI000CF03836|nr:class I SAM-dependent methyltransferase [Agrobacterium tumefaciens]NSY98674.1 class I SAM-dependent methyltransferase [Agrobacterium tumefaciens]
MVDVFIGEGSQVPGSFRDPAGHVFELNGRLYRTVTEFGASGYEAVRDAQIFQVLSEKGWLVPILKECPGSGTDRYTLEIERLQWITYPYEWSFELLKAAAVFHIDLHLYLLQRDFTLTDATAYNVQFRGVTPVFIDHLSIRPYRDGEFWSAHRQFCEQFLNPLLLRAYVGRPHNAWYRGSMEGVSVADMAAILPTRRKLSWNTLTNVVLQNRFQSGTSGDATKISIAGKKLPKQAFVGMLRQLRKWISSLVPGDKRKTVWADYSLTNTYNDAEREAKHQFVSTYVADSQPLSVIDLGCNTGEYSERALTAGARSVIGFDFDVQAIDQAYHTALRKKLSFTPLFLDARNPSPNQGWMNQERSSFSQRFRADGVLALAFEHHLAIAHNVPLASFIEWLLSIAPTGVVEFVPKSDPTVQKMLALREDIFPDYDADNFDNLLRQQARIIRKQVVSHSGRTLFQFSQSP